MKYSKLFNTKSTHQSRAIPFTSQVPNHAGGYSWNVDRWTLLDRFLILGCENGTFYVGERKMMMENAANVLEAIKEDGERVVARIAEVSHGGNAPKNDPAIFALALAASFGNDKTRAAAFDALPKVCRTGTHLFAFAEACDGMRGWGRGLRKAVAKWYNAQSADSLEYGVVKYQARGGWSNRDLLRLSHPVASTEKHNVLYKWIVDGEITGELPLVQATLALRETHDLDEAVRLVREHRVPREALPTEMLKEKAIWQALLADMPLTAMIRNLGNMTKVGLLEEGWFVKDTSATRTVVEALGNEERLKKSRIHPVAILAAMNTYAGGHGVRGGGTWKAVKEVLTALDKAFYASFGNVEKSGKRILVGLDVSGSMHGTSVAGVAGLDCRKACGAMALITEAVEDHVTHVAFDTKSYKLNISQKMRLDAVVDLLAKTGGGGTDCALPIQYAMEHKIAVDAFVIYTDSETWQGSQHPAQAIEAYRRKTGIDAKLIVVAMASTRVSIGNPGDAGTLNIVGFDTSVPQVISQFIA
ncbi:MAG: TROVE domain-containing protein [Armatimonadetes bacterium]|nr:TROVE domain-containing protein [Armatimonadota bacterium]